MKGANLKMSEVDTLLVSRSGDLLLIGRKPKRKPIEIINAFDGEEAEELYNRLITKRENKNAEISG